ncbi:MAG: hypothetical protein HYZ24_07110 [Chloroflexi bacterium]|nr:hypothetical protein [Chloroflexota bacterium]
MNEQPIKRLSQVIVIIYCDLQSLREGLPRSVFCGSRDKLCVISGMAFPRIRLLIAAMQILLSKLTDDLMHTVAPMLDICPENHQRVIDQFGKQIGAWFIR